MKYRKLTEIKIKRPRKLRVRFHVCKAHTLFINAANLKFFGMYLNKPIYPRLTVEIRLNYQLKNEISKADFNPHKQIYNWQPFMKTVNGIMVYLP